VLKVLFLVLFFRGERKKRFRRRLQRRRVAESPARSCNSSNCSNSDSVGPTGNDGSKTRRLRAVQRGEEARVSPCEVLDLQVMDELLHAVSLGSGMSSLASTTAGSQVVDLINPQSNSSSSSLSSTSVPHWRMTRSSSKAGRDKENENLVTLDHSQNDDEVSTADPQRDEIHRLRKELEGLKKTHTEVLKYALWTPDDERFGFDEVHLSTMKLSACINFFARTQSMRTQVKTYGIFPPGCKMTAEIWRKAAELFREVLNAKDHLEGVELLDSKFVAVEKRLEAYEMLQNSIRGEDETEEDEEAEDTKMQSSQHGARKRCRVAEGVGSALLPRRCPSRTGSSLSSTQMAKQKRRASNKEELAELVRERNAERHEILRFYNEFVSNYTSVYEDTVEASRSFSDSGQTTARDLAKSFASVGIEGSSETFSGEKKPFFARVAEICTFALRLQRKWISDNDTEALKEKSNRSVEKLKAVSDNILFIVDSAKLELLESEISGAFKCLGKEKAALERILVGEGVMKSCPLRAIYETLTFIAEYLDLIQKTSESVRAKWSQAIKDRDAFSEALKQKPSLSLIRELNQKLTKIERDVSDRASTVSVLQLELNDLSGGLNEDLSRQDEKEKELEREKARLEAVRTDAERQLRPIVRSLLEERAMVVEQASKHFPELLKEDEWVKVVDLICSETAFPSLDLKQFEIPFSLRIRTSTCSACMEEHPQDKGLACRNKHFLCSSCLDQQVKSMSASGHDQRIRDAKGEFPCFEPKCNAKPINISRLAAHVSERTFHLFLQAVKRTVEADVVQGMESEMEKKRKRMEEEIAERGIHEQLVEKHCVQIEENILTLKCPSGGHAFHEFSGCFALTCDRCKPRSTFCAWCLTDTGADAHAHVAYCKYNLNKTSIRMSNNAQNRQPPGYYGTIDLFEKAQRLRKARMLNAYWLDRVKHEDPEVQHAIYERIRPQIDDLTGLKLSLPRRRRKKKKPLPSLLSSSSSSSSSPPEVIELL